MALFLLLGVGLRLYHYLRNPVVWHDEAALLLNLLEKDFLDLLGPLSFCQAAPPLFLWLEKAVGLLAGADILALRLPSLAASVAALGLFAWVARKLLPAAAACWALLWFACSDNLLWHACEVKPYAWDVLAALALLAVFQGTRDWLVERRLMVFGILAPALIFLSYPACFLGGGLLLALLPLVIQARRYRAWLGYALLAAAVGTAFGLVLVGPIAAQRSDEMVHYWVGVHHFPAWDRPWATPGWAVLSTLEVCRYCCKPLGQALAPLALVGGAALWRGGRRTLVILLAVPLGLALLAGLAHCYPYGGSRLEVFAAPGLLLLMGAGLPAVLNWLRGYSRLATAAAGLVLLTPAALAAYHVVQPWPRADCASAARFIAAHCRMTDHVAGDDWPCGYYFHHLGSRFHMLPTQTPSGDRLWLVLTGVVAPKERHWRSVLPEFRRVRLRQEFNECLVLLLEKPGPK